MSRDGPGGGAAVSRRLTGRGISSGLARGRTRWPCDERNLAGSLYFTAPVIGSDSYQDLPEVAMPRSSTTGATETRMSTTPLSNPGVRFPPPFIFIIGFLAGWGLDRYVIGLPLTYPSPRILLGVGVSLVAVGVVLSACGIVTFRIARTSVIPHHSASRLVTVGPYRFTRNPMYTGLLFAYLGATALIHTVWPLVLLPFVIITLIRFVIRREEQYLSDAFGADYAVYCSRVRRWL